MASSKKIIAVYKIRNVVSGGFYIGSSGNLYERWRAHKNRLRSQKHTNPKLQAVWNKYGEDAFKFEILEVFTSIAEMENLEQELLHKHREDPVCYNLAEWVASPMRGRTGSLHPNFGKVLSPEVKAVISEASKRQWGISDPRTGQKHTDETKALISAKVQQAVAEGRGGCFIPSEETRKKMSASLMGNQRGVAKPERTEEHRRNLSIANTGNQNWLGKKHSKESKLKMSKQVLETTTGMQFPSLTAVLQHYDMKMPTLRRVLITGKPISKGQFMGLVFQYIDPSSIT